MKAGERRGLARLARDWGIQSSYLDVTGRRVAVRPEAILATLAALGAPVAGLGDVPEALADRREGRGPRLVEPVVVAWEGRLRIDLSPAAAGKVTVELETEGGGCKGWRIPVPPDGSVILPERLPLGYHRMRVTARRLGGEALVVAAPERAPQRERAWGVFVPLYALHSRHSWGVGDVGDLGALVRWVAELGAGVVATTPLDAAFLDEPFEPGPYSPASRLFWNELYLDVERIPEVSSLGAAAPRRMANALRRASLVDHRRAMALKRGTLEAALGALMARPSARREAFHRFGAAHPRLRDYALFRAALERHRRPWPSWPHGQRGGRIRPRDVDGSAVLYHRYVQWLMDEQLRSVHAEATDRGVDLGLDLPLGCHPAGYDVWRERESFALDAAAGAPPDAFFSEGQDWGFPPPHPDRIREDGYRYLRDCLRHVLSRAGVVRVDHIMAFHRLYWIPRGLDPRSGVYVRYRPDEAYAVLLLEAHRAGATVVGEDLGTVPAAVRRTMGRHGIGRSYVLQTEINAGDGVGPPPPGSAASLNTHDMPTFATFRRSGDVDLRVERGWLDPREAATERARRKERLRRVADSLPGGRGGLGARALAAMARSDAALVVVGLEDLWGETEPQNVPGTLDGANWRRRTRYPIERFRVMPRVLDALAAVDRGRRRARR